MHTFLERVLTERRGTVSGTLRAGRSRNDQAANDLRLSRRDRSRTLAVAVLDLQDSLVGLARRHRGTYAPGFTHLHPAQPVLFAHHLRGRALGGAGRRGRIARAPPTGRTRVEPRFRRFRRNPCARRRGPPMTRGSASRRAVSAGTRSAADHGEGSGSRRSTPARGRGPADRVHPDGGARGRADMPPLTCGVPLPGVGPARVGREARPYADGMPTARSGSGSRREVA
ncbi:lyase family protein [Streptomyces sp. NBC_01803]|uniref:lyase family protein n=1 Tax=Streptomyces sp. NBC_01803 TaxID=2975946 RepID=UPI003FA348B1